MCCKGGHERKLTTAAVRLGCAQPCIRLSTFPVKKVNDLHDGRAGAQLPNAVGVVSLAVLCLKTANVRCF